MGYKKRVEAIVRRVNTGDLVRYANEEARETMGDHIYKIGASLTKTGDVLRGLSRDEEEKFLSKILEVKPQDSGWVKETTRYWTDISRYVPYGDGLKLEIGFEYETASKEEVEEIYKRFFESGTLDENRRWYILYEKGGMPINIADYILYRYCLVYGRVANRKEEAGASGKIKFYLISKAQEQQEAYETHKVKVKARELALNNLRKISIVDSTLRLFGEPVESLGIIEKEMKFMNYSDTHVSKFLMYVGDKNLEEKAFIEECVALGLLNRIPNTERLLYGETLLGNNVEEAVERFKNDPSADVKTILQQLKLSVNDIKTRQMEEIANKP
jgi:hypothetical protein